MIRTLSPAVLALCLAWLALPGYCPEWSTDLARAGCVLSWAGTKRSFWRAGE